MSHRDWPFGLAQGGFIKSGGHMDWSLLGFQGLGQVLNLHPVFVHFPIALFPTALFFYLIGLLKKRRDFLLAAQICLGLGLLSTIITVLSGYLAEETFSHNETIHTLMETHEILGFTILGLGTLLVIWSFLARDKAPKASMFFLLMVGFTVLLVLQNADLGGRMVFVEGAAVKAMPKAQENPTTIPHDHHEHDHHQ